MNCRLHDLRHYHGTELADAGIPLTSVRDRLDPDLWLLRGQGHRCCFSASPSIIPRVDLGGTHRALGAVSGIEDAWVGT